MQAGIPQVEQDFPSVVNYSLGHSTQVPVLGEFGISPPEQV